MSGFFKTLWWLELVYQFKGSRFYFIFQILNSVKVFYPGMLTVRTLCIVNTRTHVGNNPQKRIN